MIHPHNMTNKECIKYLRQEAKKLGCTLKEQNITINGGKAYKYIKRYTGMVLISNQTLGSALDNFESGYLQNQL